MNKLSSSKSVIIVVPATNQQGTFLYVANLDNLISGFSVEATGVLAPVPGSPFNNGFPGGFGLISLTTFPPTYPNRFYLHSAAITTNLQ